MSKSKAHQRFNDLLMQAQGGKCCYCDAPMFILGTTTVHEHQRANKIATHRAASAMRATVEHLKKWADGGRSTPDNLALACFDCNSSRGDIPWVEFKTKKAGSWARHAVAA